MNLLTSHTPKMRNIRKSKLSEVLKDFADGKLDFVILEKHRYQFIQVGHLSGMEIIIEYNPGSKEHILKHVLEKGAYKRMNSIFEDYRQGVDLSNSLQWTREEMLLSKSKENIGSSDWYDIIQIVSYILIGIGGTMFLTEKYAPSFMAHLAHELGLDLMYFSILIMAMGSYLTIPELIQEWWKDDKDQSLALSNYSTSYLRYTNIFMIIIFTVLVFLYD